MKKFILFLFIIILTISMIGCNGIKTEDGTISFKDGKIEIENEEGTATLTEDGMTFNDEDGEGSVSFSDEELVNLCLGGEGNYFEEIVKRYKKKIYSIAYRFTGNSDESYDITQEIFIKAYNSLKKYNSSYKFSSWILKMTTNYCVDIKRKLFITVFPCKSMYLIPMFIAYKYKMNFVTIISV